MSLISTLRYRKVRY